MMVTIKVFKPEMYSEDQTVNIHVLDPAPESELRLSLTFNQNSNVSATLSPEFLLLNKLMRIQVHRLCDDQNGWLSVFM